MVGLTGFNFDMPDGNSMFLSELAGLQSVGVMSPPGSTDGEAAALLQRLGFNGAFAAFIVPQGDPLPPEVRVPEPGTLSLAGLGVLMLAGLRRRKATAARRCAVAGRVVHLSFCTRGTAAMIRAIACVAALAICSGEVRESNAGPIDVSYTVSGSPGNYDLDFSVTNNMLEWPTQNVYFFGVRLSVSDITASPVPFADRHSGWNFFNYGGSATELNNTWQAGPTLGALLPGTTLSGFIVHIPDLVAPAEVSWGAIAVSPGSLHPYTGGGNFISQANPGFEGLATPAVPEPSSLAIGTFAPGVRWNRTFSQ